MQKKLLSLEKVKPTIGQNQETMRENNQNWHKSLSRMRLSRSKCTKINLLPGLCHGPTKGSYGTTADS